MHSALAPLEVRGLLPGKHVATRRIMNRPVISKAADTERLMASEVAVGLGVRIVEALTASLRTVNIPGFVHGTDFIDTHFAVQCYFAQRRASRFGADGAVAIIVVDPCGRFPMW